jgi:hypothetical protein
VICDYLRAYGADRVAAVAFVEGAVKLGEAAFGPGFLDHFANATADDLPTNIRAMRAFLRACVASPLRAEDFETALAWNMVVPAQDPCPPCGARDRRGRRPPRAHRPAARHPRPSGHRGVAGDGRARAGHLPDRRSLQV